MSPANVLEKIEMIQEEALGEMPEVYEMGNGKEEKVERARRERHGEE